MARGLGTGGRGGFAGPALLALVALRLGNLVLGMAETLPIRQRGMNAALRIMGLLAVFAGVPALLLVAGFGP